MSNELVQLTRSDPTTGSTLALTLLVERRGPQPTVALALPNAPFNRVRYDAKRGALQWTYEHATGSSVYFAYFDPLCAAPVGRL